LRKVKVESSELAVSVVEKVAKLDLYCSISKHGSEQIFCIVTQDVVQKCNLAISLEVYSEGSHSLINLTLGQYNRTAENAQIHYITISPTFVKLLQIIDKDKFIKAMKYGLITQRNQGTLSQVDDVDNKILKSFPSLSEEDTKALNSFELPDDLFSLLCNARLSQYERNTF